MPAGKAGARLKAEDSLDDVVFVNDHDQLLFFTEEGQCFSLKAYEVPEGGRTAIGTAITQVGWEGEGEGRETAREGGRWQEREGGGADRAGHGGIGGRVRKGWMFGKRKGWQGV